MEDSHEAAIMSVAKPVVNNRPTIFLLVVTALYLLFELAFSARLLDASGGRADIHEIESIEKWGRALSGFAIALFAWGWILKRAWADRIKAVAMAITVMIAIPSMIAIQDRLIDSLVGGMTGEERRDAAFLVVSTQFLLSGNLTIEGLEVPRSGWSSPEAKAFAALFPFLAMEIPGLQKQAEDVLQSALVSYITRGCSPGSNGCIGPFDAFNNDAIIPLYERIGVAYGNYKDGVESYRLALNGIGKEQERAWQEYRQALGKRGQQPETVPQVWWPKIRRDLRQKGIAVPDNWEPNDQAGFYVAVERSITKRANSVYDKKMKEQLGKVLPKDLQIADFFLVDVIQQRLQNELGVSGLGLKITYETAPAGIQAKIYQPLVNAVLKRELAKYKSADAEFAHGGKHAEMGLQAAKRLVVPPIALGFSLLGGLTHLLKTSYLTAFLAFRRKAVAASISAIVFGSCISIVAAASNRITESDIYRQLEGLVEAKNGPLVAASLRWIIQAEPLVYPINDRIRRYPLLGQNFGFHEHTEGAN